MATSTLWLHASFSTNLSKKKKLKITFPDGDYKEAFDILCRTVNLKMLKHNPDAEVAKPEMVYKPEDEMNGPENSLEDEIDFEGMLEGRPKGEGVRVIVTTTEMGSFDVRSSSAGSSSQIAPLTPGSITRSASLNLKSIYESLSKAAKKPGLDSSYFVNPLTNRVQDVRLVDFKFEDGSARGGDSSYARVFEATYNDNRFAIKKIDGILMDCENNRPALAFEREMKFLRKTTDWKCENIVQFHGFIRTGETARLILELMDKDLSQTIESLKRSGLYNRMVEESKDFEDMGYIILRDVSNGLRFTHGHNPEKEMFMHRDIKSSNIMFKRAEHRFAIIDFGTTKKITGEENKLHSAGAGQRYYEAPECTEFKPTYCESCDIWSMGITMIKFITGKHPIWDDSSEESSSSDEHMRNIKKDNIISERITGKGMDGEKIDYPIGLTSQFLSQEFKDMINSCVNRDPKGRPSAQNIHNFAKNRADSIDPLRVEELFTKFCGN
ncbi:uncharacterized protein LOC134813017 [Bolinopsis microptera]|uniref:uncharacterized protein LOC134813017 n=1 Tax=Bolinopsis microptera TaxID=2820187 RepID=UPI003079C294